MSGHTFSTPGVIGKVEPNPLPDEFFTRLITFYKAQPEIAVSKIWVGVFETFYATLKAALATGNVTDLRNCLEACYNDCQLFGIDYGAPIPEPDLVWDQHAIRAAVSVGCLPEFNPEQDNSTVLVREDLVKKIEAYAGKLGVAKGPTGMFGGSIEGRIIPIKFLDAAAIYVSLKRLFPDTLHYVLEIGGGTGSLAISFFLLHEQNLFAYHIVDLPLVAVIQAYVMASTIGPENIALEGEDPGFCSVLVHGLKWPDVKADLFFNMDSLPEILPAAALEYLTRIQAQMHPGSLFVSINHESNVAEQTRVHELAASIKGLTLLSRTPFPFRPGYIQEIFLATPQP